VKDSVVTLEFHERGNATEVILTHAIAHDKEREGHEQGWTAIMDKLEATYSGASA
jgi:hypothetical protein